MPYFLAKLFLNLEVSNVPDLVQSDLSGSRFSSITAPTLVGAIGGTDVFADLTKIGEGDFVVDRKIGCAVG